MPESIDPAPSLEYATPAKPKEPMPVRIVYVILAVCFCGAGVITLGLGLIAGVFMVMERNAKGLLVVAVFWLVGGLFWWIGKELEKSGGSIRIR